MKIKQIATLGLLAFLPSLASALVLDFEGFKTGTIIDNEYRASNGVTINGYNRDRRRSNLAVIFDTNKPSGNDNDLGAPFFNGELGQLAPGNVLIIHENPRTCGRFACRNPDDEGSRPAGYFDFKFSDAVTLNSIDFFDIERAETTYRNAIQFFDMQGNEIMPGTFFSESTGGDNKWARQNFGVSGVHGMRIALGGSGAIDNINYSVPEPASLFLLGLGLFGIGLFRKRNT